MRQSWIGGARRNRTADLLHAMQALYQLSYDPLSQSTPDSFGEPNGQNRAVNSRHHRPDQVLLYVRRLIFFLFFGRPTFDEV
jgi:hypothetical protein